MWYIHTNRYCPATETAWPTDTHTIWIKLKNTYTEWKKADSNGTSHIISVLQILENTN